MAPCAQPGIANRAFSDDLTVALAAAGASHDLAAMIRNLCLIGAATLSLIGCGGAAPKGATESASRLLAAAVHGDRIAFEAEIDRPAVRDDVRRQMAEMARPTALDVEGGPSEFALDRMIGPDALRLVRADTGEALTAAPTQDQVARLMKGLDNRQACLRAAAAPDRCLLTFARLKGDWRLVGMQATDLKIQVAGD